MAEINVTFPHYTDDEVLVVTQRVFRALVRQRPWWVPKALWQALARRLVAVEDTSPRCMCGRTFPHDLEACPYWDDRDLIRFGYSGTL